MKKIKKLEKILLMLAVLAIICGISTVNYASETGNVDELFNIRVINNTTTENTPENTANNTATQNISTNTNKTTSLPKTGVNDTAMWVLIAGCVVLAIYTYKKVRDYNV